MIALAIGILLVLVAASGAALLLRPNGVVSLVLAVAVLAFAEVVAASHVLSFADAYTRNWLLAVVAGAAVVAVAAWMIVRPPVPSCRLGSVVHKGTVGDRLLVRCAVVVIAGLGYLLRGRGRHPAQRPRRADVSPDPGTFLDTARVRGAGTGHCRRAHQRLPAGCRDPPRRDDAAVGIRPLGRARAVRRTTRHDPGDLRDRRRDGSASVAARRRSARSCSRRCRSSRCKRRRP